MGSNLTDETDPNLNDTDHTYDPLNRLTQTLDALSGTTSYAYDVNDELISVTAPNNAQTSYSYDDLGNRLSVSSPDTGLTTYTYDAAGNRITQTDARGVTTTYTYDALNRLTSVSYPDSSLNISYGYDGGMSQLGRLTSMTDGAGTSNYSYDAFGNRISVSRTMDGVVHTTGFEYDADDRLSVITYPSGRRVDYTRNAAGEVTAVTTTVGGVTEPVASSIVYAPFGPLVSLDFGNGLSLIRIYDLQYRLTDQVTSDGATPIEDLALIHDSGGNIDQIADANDPTRTRTFDYDALDRLISDTGDDGVLAMSYDPVGNRQSLVTDDGVSITTDTLTYSPASNRLSSYDAVTVTLDAAENTLDDARGKTYIYGDHGRLLSASVGGTLQATYAYDGHGQRVRKLEATGSGRRYDYHYGPAGELLAETLYDSAGTLIEHRDYLWLDGMPLAQATGSTIVFLHTDQLDTPRLATDAVGTVIWRWASDGFGVGAADEDPDGDGQATVVSLRFPGQYYDQETGLHYNYYRTYDPTTGRYLESDPIGLAGGWNTYGYALQNPLSYTDPTGESAVARVLTGLGADTAVPDPSDAAWPKWAFWGALLAGAYVYDVCTDSDDDNFCYSRWEAEDSRCWQWKNLGMRHVKACQDRAATRRNMCNQNGGKPNPLEPPEYSPFRDYPR
ncbi:RHS repeat-associated core domain-containing protein [Lentisalinibacter salinarum]|uniref:RHS repeat-associated core domain-containing protein n=1 Tax=Lentisalinibacter salinarum TaxID=2992239 RepID=UPI00386F1A8F